MKNTLTLNFITAAVLLWFGLISIPSADTADIGEACTIDADCTVTGSECWNDTCVCVPTLNYDPGTQACVAGCTVYGTAYHGYPNWTLEGSDFLEECLMEFAINISLEECFGLCNERKRCLNIVYGAETIVSESWTFCFVSQCSILYLGDFSETSDDVTTYSRNCDATNVIANCPGGQEYSITSGACVTCPVNTYKPDTILPAALCIRCPYTVKTDGSNQLEITDCTIPIFYCANDLDCLPNGECVNSACNCLPGYQYRFETDQCEIERCTVSGFYKIPAFASQSLIDSECYYPMMVNLTECQRICWEVPTCKGVTVPDFTMLDVEEFEICIAFTCYGKLDLEYIPIIVNYIKGCKSNAIDCYPNGTIEYYNPDPLTYVDAMAIQNAGTPSAIKCTTTVNGSRIIISDCSTDLDINVFLSNRTTDFGDTFGGRVHQSYVIRCDQIDDAGVTRNITNDLSITLEATTRDSRTPDFTVSSAIRLSSAVDSVVTSAQVGEIRYWTIDIPAEYSGRPTCYAYSGTSNSGTPSIQLVNAGCTQDGTLVGYDFDNVTTVSSMTKRIWTILYVFKFYNSDNIYLECTVKVCPSSSDDCNITCGDGKRSLEETGYSNDETYFTTHQFLHILDASNGAHTLYTATGTCCLWRIGVLGLFVAIAFRKQ